MKDFFVLYKIPLWMVIIGSVVVQGWNFYQQHRLAKDNLKLKSKIDEKQYISQQSFDLELKMYTKLFDALIDAFDDFSELMPIIDYTFSDEDAEMQRRAENMKKSFNHFAKIRRSYAPFYNKEIRETLNEISKYMQQQVRYFEWLHFNPQMKEYAQSKAKEINQNAINVKMLVDKVTKQTTEYLENRNK